MAVRRIDEPIMAKQEGIIKFDLDYTPAPAPDAADLAEINHWRDVLYARRLIGQDPQRYGGYGYGNISRRLPPFDAPPTLRRFVISGTQTGNLSELAPEHYAVVVVCEPDSNHIVAEGPIRPSSESLTHGTVYDLDADLRWVLHVHSPEIWTHARSLGLPVTDPAVPYGCPEMAAEVRRLFAETDVAMRRVFAMGGHEDGIVAFGKTPEAAADALLTCLDRATQQA
jgi:ribulose-5-phosphate 4-epimerase/fuculose-1-phosphate aldolase